MITKPIFLLIFTTLHVFSSVVIPQQCGVEAFCAAGLHVGISQESLKEALAKAPK